MSLRGGLERCWYGRCAARFLLIPFSLLFRLLVALRRSAYAWGWLRGERLPVPVVVVGNITVGGTGKTPLILQLVQWLRDAGHHPGVVSRGYRGRADCPAEVTLDADPALVGDEPLLLARRSSCPVWVGRRRAEAGRALLAAHPEVDVILADDGLQHYALARDLEIAVIDGVRGLGSGWLLPAGPLRETPARLDAVDAIVVNGDGPARLGPGRPVFAMRMLGDRLRHLLDPAREVAASALGGRTVHALAGIGHPQRFFDHLAGLGLTVVPHAFPDHHDYVAADLPSGTLIMTEKDAVKCAALCPADAWMLPVDAEVEAGLKELLITRLDALHGRETA